MIPISHEDFTALKALDDARRAAAPLTTRVADSASRAFWYFAEEALCINPNPTTQSQAYPDRLLGLLIAYPERPLEECLNDIGYAVIEPDAASDHRLDPLCYIAVSGDTGSPVRVFANPDAAYEFSGNTEAGIGTDILDIPFEPHVDVPDGMDLDRLAAQLADTISDHQHAEGIGFSVNTEAVLPALPAFITACLARQAELDS
jgi:hypothetical protein